MLDRRESLRFRMTWGWVDDDEFHYFWCSLLSVWCVLQTSDYRLLQCTFISLSFLLFSLSLFPSTHSWSFVCDFSHSAQHQWAHLLYRNVSLQVPLPLLFLFKETVNHLVLTFFTPKLLSKEAFTWFTHNLRRQDAICKSNLLVLTDVIFHALVVTLLCVVNCCPLAVSARHYATEDKNSLGFSSLGRINITSRYVTCCYGDGLTVLFTEKRRWFGGEQSKGMRSRWRCLVSGGLLP